MNNLIKTFDFCWVVSSKKLKDSGLVRGDLVLVSGVKPVPASKKDHYLQRILVVVLKWVDDKLEIPKSDNNFKAYLVDPRNLEKVSKDLQEELEEKINRYYETDNVSID